MVFNINQLAGQAISNITKYEKVSLYHYIGQSVNEQGEVTPSYETTDIMVQAHNTPLRDLEFIDNITQYGELRTFYTNDTNIEVASRSGESGGDYLIYKGYRYDIINVYTGSDWQKFTTAKGKRIDV